MSEKSVSGPVPVDQRQSIPDNWREQLPQSDTFTVQQYRRALLCYVAGHSCAQCQVRTGVNAESLRKLVNRLGLTRSRGEAQSVRHLKKRRHACKLFKSPIDRGTVAIARLVDVCKGTIIAWRQQWRQGLPLREWSS